MNWTENDHPYMVATSSSNSEDDMSLGVDQEEVLVPSRDAAS